MPKLRNDRIGLARRAVRMLLDYQHPITRCGLMTEAVLQLRALDRELREREDDFTESVGDLYRRYGESMDNSGRLESMQVKASSPHRAMFDADVAELQKQEVEVARTINLKVLVCRNEDGKREQIEPAGTAFVDLGDLLVVDEEQETAP